MDVFFHFIGDMDGPDGLLLINFSEPADVPRVNFFIALPVLFMFHGYNLRAADWIQLLPYAAAGFAVAALDVRGQAGESEDPGGVVGTTYHGHIVRGLSDPDTRKLFFRNVFLDAVMLTRVVGSFQETDVSRMATIGTSQGGAVALACAALADIKMTAVCYPFLCDYQRVWQMNLVHQSYAELKDYFRAFDPTHVHKTELFTKLGYIDVQHLAPRIRAKVRMFTGMMDDNCPPSAQFAVFNKIAGPKEITLYPDYGHERLPGWEDEVLQWLLAEL